MEPDTSVAHRLPILYREALDAIAGLERESDRAVAARLRRDVQAVYALRWDEDACRRLRQLALRARDLAEPARRRRAVSLRPAWLAHR